MEAEILIEIRDSEKKAGEIVESAKREKEAIIHEALKEYSKLLGAKDEDIRDIQEKKIIEFREKAKLIREEKLAEGKTAAKQAKAKAEKNIANAVELVIKKFEEVI